jgi:hypothetical protein
VTLAVGGPGTIVEGRFLIVAKDKEHEEDAWDSMRWGLPTFTKSA